MTEAPGRTRTLRRTAGTVTALLAATALLEGCGSTDEPAAAPTGGATAAPTVTASPSPSPTANPKETLLAAVPDEGAGPFRFSGKDGSMSMSGRVDPDALGYEISTVFPKDADGISGKMSFLMIKEDLWMKLKLTGHPGLPRFPDKWMKLDKSKLDDKESVPAYEGADPGQTTALIEAATTVKEQGPGSYTGFIDLTKGEAADALDEGEAKALGKAGRRVPFTATITDEHLTSLVLNIPAAGGNKAYQYVAKYTGFGSTPVIVRPTGDQATKAPALAYEMLNS
ncbi:hypothetical protein [Micromonospora siamensis]|uniref:Lipoprotein n=1 Tax=Micromonospora siamensis TaxID=299152 RepID=A0A1C5K7A1_9ACTN|nr:hypothetical protein [Micromonospora siamensis]SCG78597.1 hypothetical protein GA0074704_5693 [Micromonospora siamensis]